MFSTAIGDNTQERTYEWLKTNRELINVATSRAKDKLVVLADMKNVERLHKDEEQEVESLVKDIMENAYKLEVPLVVDVNKGTDWYEAK